MSGEKPAWLWVGRSLEVTVHIVDEVSLEVTVQGVDEAKPGGHSSGCGWGYACRSQFRLWVRTSLEVTVQGVGEAKSGGHSSHCG